MHSQKYDSVTQKLSNMNNFGQTPFYQTPQMPQYGNYQYPPYNNYYPNVYPPYVGNQPYYNQNVLSTDSTLNLNQNTKNKPPEKRESKPLVVIDPKKNEPLDLAQISKNKNNSLLNEIQHQNTSENQIPAIELAKIENKFIEQNEKQFEPAPISPEKENNYICKENNYICKENIDICKENNDICKENSLKSFTPANMKQSHSTPNKLDNLSEKVINLQISSSSETTLHQKSISTFNDLENFNNDRKIYDMDSLLEIGKSDRSCERPAELKSCECQDIIVEFTDCPKNLTNWIANLLQLPNKRKVINFGSPKSSSLSRTTNGYLPPHLRMIVKCSANKHLEDCVRNLKCILNKIVPQNFKVCIAELKSIIKSSDPVNVKIDDCIDCLIEEIFDKAVKEEAYSVTYANLCTQIANFDDENESRWNFKSSLLNRCKKMFETPLQDQLKSVREHWEKKIEDESDAKLKTLYISDIEEQVQKARDKYFGNIRFIGELYVHDLLKPKIINACVQTLITKVSDEDAMLSLCKLIETCGKKFNEKHTDIMSEYIKNMIDIVSNNQMENRIRYRIVDIIEMSERKWALRKIQAQKMIQPKTLEEVKNDDIEDKAMSALKYPPSKVFSRLLNSKSNQNETKFKPNRNQTFEVNSLSVAQSESYDLKPSYGNWSSTNKDINKDAGKWTNVDNKKKRYPQSTSKHSQNHNKSSPIKSRDDSPGKIGTNKFAQLVMDEDGFDSSLASSDSPIRDSSPCGAKVENDNVFMNADDLLKDLLESKKLNDAGWQSQNDFDDLITCWLDGIMEKDRSARSLIGDVLENLVACEKLPKNKLIDGLRKFLELIDDLITDIPKIWLFLSEFLERFIKNTNSYIEFFKIVFEDKISEKGASECIIMTLKFATIRLGQDVIKEIFDRDFQPLVLNIKDIEAKLQSHDLLFLIHTQKCSIFDKFTDQFKSELISLLPNDVEPIYRLLDKFTHEEMSTEEFVLSTATCLFSFICGLPAEIDVTNFLLEKQLFFIRLIDSNPAFEKQTLLALVKFANDLKEKDFLLITIKNLRGKIISDDAFTHFSDSSKCSSITDVTNKDPNYNLLVSAIRSTLENAQR